MRKEGKSYVRFSRQDAYDKRKKKRKKILYILVPILILLSGIGVYAGSIILNARNAVADAQRDLERGEHSDLREEAVQPLTHNVSVLIVGVDEAIDDEPTRSDALLLATFNVTDKSVYLTSIPRDTRTYLPKQGRNDKINHAYAFDGIDGSIAAVEELLEVPVDYFVKFNFASFMEVVDSLGGIQVDVPLTLNEQDSRRIDNQIQLEPGLQWLNGEEALALARTRRFDNDLFRGQRQMVIIEAILDRAMSFNSLTRVNDVIDAIDGNFTTNLTMDDMLSFYQYGRGMTLHTMQLGGTDEMINGVYYLEPNEESLANIREILHAHLNDLPIPSKVGDDSTTDDSTTTNDSSTMTEENGTSQQ